MDNWADEVENEDGDEMGLELDMLPPFERIQRDGFIYEISFEKRDDNTVVRKCRKNKKQQYKKRVAKAAIQRRRVPKFGQCAGQNRGTLEKGITEQNVEEATFHWTYASLMKEEHEPQLNTSGKGFPQINLPERREEQMVDRMAKPEEKEGFKFKGNLSTLSGRPGGTMAQINSESYELRVSNVPFATERMHMYELIEGIIGRKPRNDEGRPRVKERTRGEDEKHFYVQFRDGQDAVDVMSTLNGYKYGHMVMSVEWSRQSKKPDPNLKPGDFRSQSRLRNRRGGFGRGDRRGGFGDRGPRRSFGGDRRGGYQGGGSTLSSRSSRGGFRRGGRTG